jgi:hypothetical protein
MRSSTEYRRPCSECPKQIRATARHTTTVLQESVHADRQTAPGGRTNARKILGSGRPASVAVMFVPCARAPCPFAGIAARSDRGRPAADGRSAPGGGQWGHVAIRRQGPGKKVVKRRQSAGERRADIISTCVRVYLLAADTYQRLIRSRFICCIIAFALHSKLALFFGLIFATARNLFIHQNIEQWPCCNGTRMNSELMSGPQSCSRSSTRGRMRDIPMRPAAPGGLT